MKLTNLKKRLIILSVFVLLFLGLSPVNNTQAIIDKDRQGSRAKLIQQENSNPLPQAPQDNKVAANAPEYAPNQLIVKLKDGKTTEDIKDLNAKYNVTSSEKVFKDSTNPQDTLNQLKDKLAKFNPQHEGWYWQLDKNSQEYKDYIAKISKEKKDLQKQIQGQEELIQHLEQRQERAPSGISSPNLDNIQLLKTSQDTNVLAMAQEYKANPSVEYAEPDYIYKAQMTPNDPYYSSSNTWGQGYDDLWGLKKIQASSAWDVSQGEGVIVAVIDSGVDYNHEDIAANIWTNPGEIPGNGIDDDHNGFIDDIRGWNFVANNNDPLDDFGHGTHCAGTIAAIGNNSKGIIGVAPKAKIMAIKGLNSAGNGSTTDLANCIRYAADNGADVLSNSWGAQASIQLITDAVNYASAKGCVIVAAAGNSNIDVMLFSPANIPNVIAVASTDHNDKKSDFSNFGYRTDVAAPGGESGFWKSDGTCDISKASIVSLRANNTDMFKGYTGYTAGDAFYPIPREANSKYYRALGTSMACPHVAGVAALIIAHRPDFNNNDIRGAIIGSADDIGEAGKDPYFGFGRINAAKALQTDRRIIMSFLYSVDESTSGNGDGILNPGERIDLIIRLKNYWLPANNVALHLTTSSGSLLTVVNGASSLGSMAPGEEKSGTLQFKICPTAAVPALFSFQLLITADGYSDTENFTVDYNPREGGIKRNYSQYYPAISGNLIVWENGTPDWQHDIYVYDLLSHTDRRISFSTTSEYPDIDGNRIVWNDYNKGIYLYDLSTNTSRLLTTNNRTTPKISGDRVVYINNNSDVCVYDLSTNIERKITTNAASRSEPAISGNRIVWVDNRNGNKDIYLYDLATNTERQITTNTADQSAPAISGNLIVWEDFRTGLYTPNIYLYDLSTNTERQINPRGWAQRYPDIDGNRIVWSQVSSTKFDIFLYDLATNTVQQITTNPFNQIGAVISENRIVWEDDRNDADDIYFYNLGDITPPQTPIVCDDGDSTSDLAKLSASWSSSDPESNIIEYQYSILQDSIAGTIIRDWTSTGTALSVTATGLSLTEGKTYYFAVKAKNGAGLWSDVGYSDGITALSTIPYALSVIPASVNPGCNLTLTWRAPSSHSAKDWVGLYKKGDPNTAFIWWQYVPSGASGTITVAAPVTSGDYEFRYLLDNGYADTVRSQTVTVNGTNTLNASPTTVNPGASVTVSWTASSDHSSTDWIGLYKKGDANTAYLWWQFVPAGTSGTINVTAPSTPGDYEFRYLINNSYTDTVRSQTVTVNATTTYTLILNATNGSVAKSPSQTNFAPGTVVTLTATPNIGYSFSSWSGDLTGSTNPATITMNSNKTVTANFTLNTYIITASAGTGGSIAPSGAVSVASGASQLFTVTANSGYSINQILVDGSAVTLSATYIFSNVTANHTIAASFTQIPLTEITVTASNASGNPGQANIPVAISVNNIGSRQIMSVDLELDYNSSLLSIGSNGVTRGTLISGWDFMANTTQAGRVIISMYKLDSFLPAQAGSLVNINFNVNSSAQAGTTPLQLVKYIFNTAAAEHKVDGVFTVNAPTTYTLTLNATNGSVAKSPSQTSYAPGTVVTLTATPNTGYSFSSWSGDLTGSTNPATITMNSNKTVTANCTQISANTLTASPTTVNPGANITVSWTAPANHAAKDWVGLYKKVDANTAFLWWQYVPAGTLGTINVTAPGTPGDYEFRYLIDNSYTVVAQSQTVTVNSTNTLTASPTTVNPGATVAVSWTASSNHSAKDWIGLYKKGDANTAFLWWQFVPAGTSGTINVTASSTPGDYEFRYLINNSYTDTARSQTVTVTQ